MSILKWKKNNKWISIYADAIKNRLMRTANLSDLTDKTAALNNLGLTGDVETHHHDSRYLPMFEKLENKVKEKFKALKFKVGGDVAESNATQLEDGTYSFNLTNIRATSINIEQGNGNAMPALFINNTKDKEVKYVPDITYNSQTKTLNIPNIRTGTIAAEEITGQRIYGSYWSDYAEFFPKGEETNPGDLIMLNPHSDTEEYVAHTGEQDIPVIGVHSDEFGHIIGGEDPIDKQDFLDYNLDRNIPVALTGRVHVSFVGKAKRNNYVVPSDVKGCAKLYDATKDNPLQIIGILVEDDDRTDKRRLRIKLK
jgi:hypothetical protein|nr:MAG TPA: peptidase [Bacteriophage sp.]